MGEVPADTIALLIRLPGSLGRARMRVAEFEEIMNVVADRLDTSPPKRTPSKQVPGDCREAVRLAVTAAEQEHQGFFRQGLHGVLDCTGANLIGLANVPNNGVCRQTDLPSRSHDPT